MNQTGKIRFITRTDSDVKPVNTINEVFPAESENYIQLVLID